MFGNIFYHQTMRKVVAVFGTLFNDLYIVRRDVAGAEVKRIKVPLAYGPKEKYLTRVGKEPEFNAGYTIELPRLSFQLTSFAYDGSRKLNTMHVNRRGIENDPNHVNRQFNPVSYKVGMDLYVMTKYIDDANQIVEQILPWFTPDYTVSIRSIPELSLTDDMPITIQSVVMNDNYEDDWTTRRDIVWTLSFEIKTNFYGPVKPRDVITKTQIDVLAPIGDMNDPQVLNTTPRIARHTIEPLPGSTFGNIFGYIDTYQEFTDLKKYNPTTGLDEEIVIRINLQDKGIVSKEHFGVPKIS